MLHELAAPTVEAWAGLRAAPSPFEYRYEAAQYQFLRAAIRPALTPLQSPTEDVPGEQPPSGGTVAAAVVAAGLVDKMLLLLTEKAAGSDTAVRLPIKEAREGFAALLLVLWWGDDQQQSGGAGAPEKQPGRHAPVGPPLELVQEMVQAVRGAVDGDSEAAGARRLAGAAGWVLRDYIAREPAPVIHQRLAWLYSVYGSGLSVQWPHAPEGGRWPPSQGPWQLTHERRAGTPDLEEAKLLKSDDDIKVAGMPSAESILRQCALVNSHFQLGTTTPNNDWTGGVYQVGNLAHYRASRNASLLEYAVRWGDSHRWALAGYRGCHGNLGCPDNICAAQGYAEIFQEVGRPEMLNETVAAIESAATRSCAVRTNSSQAKDSDACWWWVDALFMALPSFARVGAIVGGDAAERIWDAARAQYNITVAGIGASGANAFNLWSEQDSLFFRDDSFIGKVKW